MKLLDQVRQKLRLKHYSWATEKCYVAWIERYIFFHKQGIVWRHPNSMGAREVEQYLTHLAVDRHVSASTQNQAFGALLFLYEQVMEMKLGDVAALRARRKQRLPCVLTRDEVKQLLDAVDRVETTEPYGVMCRLMYGAGMRLMEVLRLRVKDVNLERNQIAVRAAKATRIEWCRCRNR